MTNLLEPGIYKGRIADYGIKKTSKGDPAPTIVFEVKDSSGAAHRVFWQGSWNGKGMDIAMEALLVCGLSNPSRLKDFAGGRDSGVLDLNRSLDLDIEVQVNQNDSSKKYNKVKWINADGSTKFKDSMVVEEFAPHVEQFGLIGELMRVAQARGYQLEDGRGGSRPQQQQQRQSTLTVDDIPF